jgi:hypothetical protein
MDECTTRQAIGSNLASANPGGRGRILPLKEARNEAQHISLIS